MASLDKTPLMLSIAVSQCCAMVIGTFFPTPQRMSVSTGHRACWSPRRTQMFPSPRTDTSAANKRWAIIPVVKVAQRETVLTLPPELDVPWKLLQSRYGLTSESSNLTANFIHNFTDSGEYALKINVGMPDHIQQCEELFARIPYDMERLALPIYNEVIEAIIAYENSDKAAVVGHLENISLQLKDALGVFYENMHNGRIPRSVWMSHVQGFQAWGLEKIDRETNTGEKIHVRDDGLSGSHILLFQVLDAFLGIERYLSPADFLKFVPARQREFCDIVRKYSPRGRLSLGPEVASDDGHARLDSMIDSGFKRIAERLRVSTPPFPKLGVETPNVGESHELLIT